jgi:UrcA family protein
VKTFKLNLYAVPVALLVMASGLASQTASAETTGHYKTIVARFSYDAAEPAERIYADLKRTAERLCADQGPRPISLRSYERQCTSDLVQAAVDAIARVDVAAVHTRVLNS